MGEYRVNLVIQIILSVPWKNALKASTKPAVIHEDTVLTWQEFWERSNRLANALIKLGLKKEIGFRYSYRIV